MRFWNPRMTLASVSSHPRTWRRAGLRLGVLALALLLLCQPAMPALAQLYVGNAQIFSDQGDGNRLEVIMWSIDPPPAGSHYEGWLRTSDGNQITGLGTLPISGNGEMRFNYTSRHYENLFVYSVFEITVEPDGDTDPTPSGVTPYRGEYPAPMVPAVRELLYQWPGSRFGVPAALGLYQDIERLERTMQDLETVSAQGDLVRAKQFAERLVNTVEGQSGASFGDHNGDGQVQGPGDGTGTLAYARATAARARIVSESMSGDETIVGHANNVSGSVEQQIIPRLQELRDQALQFQAVSDAAQAQQLAASLHEKTRRAMSGFDSNANGSIDTRTEAGILDVFADAQLLGTFEVRTN